MHGHDFLARPGLSGGLSGTMTPHPALAERALHHGEKRYRRLVDLSPTGS
jgi:hypothetical protein